MHKLFRANVPDRPKADDRSDAGPNKPSENSLQGHVERLSMVCQALWTLLRDNTDLTDEDLVARVREVDLSDGILDGKVRRTSTQCASCGRMVAARHARCLYCGARNEALDTFG